MQENFQPITKNMLVNEIIEKYPEAVVILMGYGLHCVNCHFSSFDTLEVGASLHGIDDETIEMMVRDLNSLAEEIENSKENKNKII